jgi:hypothetical protein
MQTDVLKCTAIYNDFFAAAFLGAKLFYPKSK